MPAVTMGLLAGWKRRDTSHGLVLTLQFADGTQPTDEADLSKIVLALGDEQLCSLTRDLARAAHDRHLKIWARQRPSILLGVDRLIERLLRPAPAAAADVRQIALASQMTRPILARRPTLG